MRRIQSRQAAVTEGLCPPCDVNPGSEGLDFQDVAAFRYPARLRQETAEIRAHDNIVFQDADVLIGTFQQPSPRHRVAGNTSTFIARHILEPARVFCADVGAFKVGPIHRGDPPKIHIAQHVAHARHAFGVPVEVDDINAQ